LLTVTPNVALETLGKLYAPADDGAGLPWIRHVAREDPYSTWRHDSRGIRMCRASSALSNPNPAGAILDSHD
jgi:hypothetical protein